MFWFNNTQLDWAKYVVHCDNYNTNLKETKAVIHLAQQTRSGVVEGLRALQPPNCKCERFVSKVVHGQIGTKIKGCQISNETITC
jgi:hypothetical protein